MDMDKVMKTITRERHLKLLPLTYGHGQSHEEYNKSKTSKTFAIDIYGHRQIWQVHISSAKAPRFI